MVHERYFYDPAARRYTVDRYLNDLDQRYGGIDSVLIWHPYPNLGVDNRNQFDLLRDLETVPDINANRSEPMAEYVEISAQSIKVNGVCDTSHSSDPLQSVLPFPQNESTARGGNITPVP